NWTQRASRHGDFLSDLERSLQFRSEHYRPDAIHERRSAHDYRRSAGKVPRHVRGILVQLLGADIDAGDVRYYGLQIGRSWRALDRGLRDFESRRVTSASAGRAEFALAALGEGFSGYQS